MDMRPIIGCHPGCWTARPVSRAIPIGPLKVFSDREPVSDQAAKDFEDQAGITQVEMNGLLQSRR